MGFRTGNPAWKPYPSMETPVTAEALNNIENAIDELEIEGGGQTYISDNGDGTFTLASEHLLVDEGDGVFTLMSGE